MLSQFSPARTSGTILLLRGIVIAGFIACYPLAWVLPVKLSWENQLIENMQAGLLFIGFLLALYWSIKTKTTEYRWFWLMVMPVWFILFGRELSWGAVFLSPSSMDAVTGPIFSSARLWYKPIVYPCVGALLLFCAGVFILTKQYCTLARLWSWRALPLFELALAALGAVLSTAAEGHAGLLLPGDLNEGASQVIEEFTELCLYMALLVAQLRVYFCLRQQSSS